MDTVEPSKGKTAVVHSDGTITSDGTTVLGSDDLAGVVAILEALTCIVENNIPHPPIEIIFSVCEEKYCWGMNAFDFGKIKSKQAYVFDLDGEIGSAAIYRQIGTRRLCLAPRRTCRQGCRSCRHRNSVRRNRRRRYCQCRHHKRRHGNKYCARFVHRDR